MMFTILFHFSTYLRDNSVWCFMTNPIPHFPSSSSMWTFQQLFRLFHVFVQFLSRKKMWRNPNFDKKFFSSFVATEEKTISREAICFPGRIWSSKKSLINFKRSLLFFLCRPLRRSDKKNLIFMIHWFSIVLPLFGFPLNMANFNVYFDWHIFMKYPLD